MQATIPRPQSSTAYRHATDPALRAAVAPQPLPDPSRPGAGSPYQIRSPIGATPAVQNAVVDALAPFGVRYVDMPANGERVWRAVQDARHNPLARVT